MPSKTTVYFNIPNTNIQVYKNFPLSSPEQILQKAYSAFKIRSSVPIKRCRLLVYDIESTLLRSIDDKKDSYIFDAILEIREEGIEFEIFGIEDFNVKVYQLSWNKFGVLDVNGPFEIQTNDKKSVPELKNSIAKKCRIEVKKAMQLAVKDKSAGVSETCILQDQTCVEDTNLKNGTKVFMTTDQNVERFKQIVAEEAINIWTLHFSLTKKQVETLQSKSQETEDNSNNISCHGNDESRFFKATHYDKIEDFTDIQDLWKVLVDRRMTIGKFIANLERFIPVKNLGLHKKFDLNLELDKMFQNEKNLIDAFDIVFEFGRVLSEEEFVVNLYYLNLDEVNDFEDPPFICRYIFKENSSVGATKKEIIEHIRGRDKKYEDMTFESTRLRDRVSEILSYPGEIILDDTKVTNSGYNDGIYIQHLKSSNQTNMLDDLGNQLSDNCNLTLVRKFSPSTKKLGKLEEIVVNEISELKVFLSKLSGIPQKNIELAIALFSSDEDENDTKRLVKRDDFDFTWIYSKKRFLRRFSGECDFYGYVFIYKDNTEQRPSVKPSAAPSEAATVKTSSAASVKPSAAPSFYLQSIKWFSRLWNDKIISNKKNLEREQHQ